MNGANITWLDTMRKEIGDKKIAVKVRANLENKVSVIDPTRVKSRMMNLEGILEEDDWFKTSKFLLVG